MKARLNITIEETVLMQIKHYAAAKQVSVSQIIEDHLRLIVKSSAKKKNLLDVVDQLKAPSDIPQDVDLKKSFYEDQSDKYGF